MSTGDWLHTRAAELMLYHHLPGVTVEDVEDLLAQGARTEVPAETVIGGEGEASNALFIILEGRIQVLLRDSAGQDRELASLEAPALVGHVGLLEGAHRSATYVAELPTTFVAFDRTLYEQLIRWTDRGGTTFRRLLLSSMTRQLSARNDRLRSVMGRIARDEVAASVSPAPKASRKKGWSQLRGKKLVGDETEVDVLELAGLAEGWNVDTAGMDRISVVEDEDQKRNKPRSWRKR